jgi:TusA-related sulfurtransferase
VIRLAQRIAESPIRGIVLLLTDDPAAPEDVRLWCLGHRHELVSSAFEGGHFRIRVRRSR